MARARGEAVTSARIALAPLLCVLGLVCGLLAGSAAPAGAALAAAACARIGATPHGDDVARFLEGQQPGHSESVDPRGRAQASRAGNPPQPFRGLAARGPNACTLPLLVSAPAVLGVDATSRVPDRVLDVHGASRDRDIHAPRGPPSASFRV